MLPTTLNEHQIHPFAFYFDGKVRQGMRHDYDLFGLAQTFTVKDRLKAYELAQVLTDAGCRTVVTVSDQYKLWIQLTPSGCVHWQQCLTTQENRKVVKQKPDLGKELAARWQQTRLFHGATLTEAFA